MRGKKHKHVLYVSYIKAIHQHQLTWILSEFEVLCFAEKGLKPDEFYDIFFSHNFRCNPCGFIYIFILKNV